MPCSPESELHLGVSVNTPEGSKGWAVGWFCSSGGVYSSTVLPLAPLPPSRAEKAIWGQTAPPLNKACGSILLPKPQIRDFFLQIKNTSQISPLTKSSLPNVFMLTTNCQIFFNVAAVTLTWHIWLRLHALKIWNQKVLVPTATTGSNYPGSGNF